MLTGLSCLLLIGKSSPGPHHTCQALSLILFYVGVKKEQESGPLLSRIPLLIITTERSLTGDLPYGENLSIPKFKNYTLCPTLMTMITIPPFQHRTSAQPPSSQDRLRPALHSALPTISTDQLDQNQQARRNQLPPPLPHPRLQPEQEKTSFLLLSQPSVSQSTPRSGSTALLP